MDKDNLYRIIKMKEKEFINNSEAGGKLIIQNVKEETLVEIDPKDWRTLDEEMLLREVQLIRGSIDNEKPVTYIVVGAVK